LEIAIKFKIHLQRIHYFITMSKIFLLTTLVVFSSVFIHSQDLPLGYIVHFEANFSSPRMPGNFLFSKHSMRKVDKGWFNLSEKQDSVPSFYPGAVALVNNNIFGEFIASLKLNPKVNKADSSSAFFLIVGLRDSLNYYFVKMNSSASIFCRMYKGKISTLTTDSTLVLDNNKPVNLLVKRDILNRAVIIEKNKQAIHFTDPNLVMGYFGIGVENSSVAIDKITIWAPTSIDQPAPIFEN
jgi:hypothetical protein